jgi:ribosome recycling factor
MPEDQVKDLEDELQKLTDKYGKEIDTVIEAKTKEIMTV